MKHLSSIYDPENARNWLLWKSESANEDDLRVFIKILAYSLLNEEVYSLFYERIQADRKKNLVDG